MNWDKNKFLSIPEKLNALDPNSKALWGIMTPQHMVEHVVGAWRISNGRAQVAVMLKGEELKKRRDFLFGDDPYAQNITNPVFGDGLAPLRKANLKAAIDQLENEMIAFFDHFAKNPDVVEAHPVFGELDYNGWIRFQSKHMLHHLAQFDLD
ncbi:DUF1569 domain-containing protein [bacterium]|nr:DUF1569 domain-containing protein [bacterium]MDC1221618.1 DUF1569 domain-containing protein [Salibacteraceae bacterium]